jgi:hypothetical protein
MKQIDVRFSSSDMASLKELIGQKMLKYKCDPFEFSTSVYGIVGIAFENASFAFTNVTAVMDYFGDQEDVALFKMKRVPFSSIHSMIPDQTMVETPVESVISDILLVNEQQQLFEKGIKTYEVFLTRGIIFQFKDGHELSLEKNIWFSEDITVEKGYDLIRRYTPTTEFEEGWSADYRGKCSREIASLSE